MSKLHINSFHHLPKRLALITEIYLVIITIAVLDHTKYTYVKYCRSICSLRDSRKIFVVIQQAPDHLKRSALQTAMSELRIPNKLEETVIG